MTGRRARAGAVLRVAAVAVVVVMAGGCGDSDSSDPGVGVSLEMRHTEPLRSGAAVRWTLVLRNDRPSRLDLEFGSGKDGDVVLLQGDQERYRWSSGRFFTEAVRKLALGANETRTFALEDPKLAVAPGQYDLVASLASKEKIPPVTKKVNVSG